MTAQNRTVLKGYFETGDRPTQVQFANLIDSFPLISGDTMTGELLLSGNPSNALGAAPKQYVDAAVSAASAPFVDTNALIKGSSDATKLARFEVDGLTASTTRVLTVQDASGTVAYLTDRKVLQRVGTLTGAVSAGTTTIPTGDTQPTNTQGTQFISQTITPTNSSSILVIDGLFNLAASTPCSITAALFQDAIVSALNTGAFQIASADAPYQIKIHHEMTAGATSATTFKMRAGGSVASSITFNGIAGTRLFGGVNISSLMITEYSP